MEQPQPFLAKKNGDIAWMTYLSPGAFSISILFLGLTLGTAFGQEPGAGKKKEIEIPKAEIVTLTTKDPVPIQLKATYLQAPNAMEVGKRTIPFILLHGWEGDRSSLNIFAEQLQKAGCAVIMPDLRGHGESIDNSDPKKTLDTKKFRKSDYLNLAFDIEACKRFLVKKNNLGELNIDLLTVVAMDQMGVVALNWTLSDWFEFPPTNLAGIKQGQDVKAMVLVSPTKKLGTINLNEGLRHPMLSGRNPKFQNLPTFIAWAENDVTAAKDSESIYETMAKGRSESENDKEKAEKPGTLVKSKIPDVDFSGASLLNENPSLRVAIMRFVAEKVGNDRDSYPWTSRAPKKEE